MSLNLKALRNKAGLTQRQAANRIGVSVSTVGMWEIGATSPRAGLFPKIAEIYGCTMAALFGEEK